MFLKVILYFCAFSFSSKCIFVFFFKNWFRGSFARSSRLRASCETSLREINFFTFIQRVSLLFRGYFATKLFSRNVFQAKTEIFQFHTKAIATVSQLSCDCFVTKSFSRKLQCVSRLPNPRKIRVFSFYVADVTIFQILCFSLTLPLSNPSQPKINFHSKTHLFQDNLCKITSR